MVKSSERVLFEHGSRLCVRAAYIEGKPDLADPPKRSKVLPPRSRALPSCFEQLRQPALASTTGRWSAGDDMNRISTALQNSFVVAPQGHGALLTVRFHPCWDMSTGP